MRNEIDVFLRSKHDDKEEYEFLSGWVNTAKKVGAVTCKHFLKTEVLMSFVLAKDTKAYRKAGSKNLMLCVDEENQTTFNLDGTATKLPKEVIEKIDIMFDEAIWDQMIPSKMSTIRLLAICLVSAVIGGVIVYQYYNMPDPALWKEFLEWKEKYGHLVLMLLGR